MKWYKFGIPDINNVSIDDVLEGTFEDIKRASLNELVLEIGSIEPLKEDEIEDYFKTWNWLTYYNETAIQYALTEEYWVLYVAEEYVEKDRLNDKSYLRGLVMSHK
jgi:hypothetical protein